MGDIQKLLLEVEIWNINNKLRYNYTITRKELDKEYKKLQDIRISIWNIDKRIRLNKKLKKIRKWEI